MCKRTYELFERSQKDYQALIGQNPKDKEYYLCNDYILVDENYMTSKDNVYAIGDVIKKEYYQLITASNDGIVAASNIINKIK